LSLVGSWRDLLRRANTRGGALVQCFALSLLIAGNAAAQVRYDNWIYYQRNTDDSTRWQYRMRFDVPFALDGGWTFTQRAYLPLVYYTDRTGPENPGGGWKAGTGDWFFDETFTTPELAKNTRGILGARFILPTGGGAPFGGGQYQVAPFAGMSFAFPDSGLTITPLFRYFMSVHATEEGAGRVRKLDFFPTVAKKVAEGWTVILWNENAITYNQVSRKWFVPIEAQLVRRARKDLEFAFGAAYGAVRDDPQFLTQVFTRVTLYF